MATTYEFKLGESVITPSSGQLLELLDTITLSTAGLAPRTRQASIQGAGELDGYSGELKQVDASGQWLGILQRAGSDPCTMVLLDLPPGSKPRIRCSLLRPAPNSEDSAGEWEGEEP